MIDIATVSIGQRVHYKPEHYKADDKFENGIVKEIPEHTNTEIRVVYNCAGDWENYKEYTSQLTPVKHLFTGWKHKEIITDGDS